MKYIIFSILFLSNLSFASENSIQEPPVSLDNIPEDAVKFSEGIHYKVLKSGPQQDRLLRDKFFEFEMKVWSLNDKTMHFNSVDAGMSTYDSDAIKELTPGVYTAVKNTPFDERRLWWISPENLMPGYPGLPVGTLLYDLTIFNGIEPIPAPIDVSMAPNDAIVTESGLAYKIIKKGTNSVKPTENSIYTVFETGWTTDGEMFWSTRLGSNPKPGEYPVNGVIRGIGEGIKLMSIGDEYRFWIPGNLAYGNNPRPGYPTGMLVFDVELLSFKENNPNE